MALMRTRVLVPASRSLPRDVGNGIVPLGWGRTDGGLP
jgi:hypothetical protein